MPSEDTDSAKRIPRPKKRGGRRAGAGAPKGNLNALRSGRHSKQFKAVMLTFMLVPQMRRVLFHHARLEQRRRLELAEAAKEYRRLTKLPSRRRSIKSIQAAQTPEDADSLRTIIRRLEDTR